LASYTFAAYQVPNDYLTDGGTVTVQDVVSITFTDNDTWLDENISSDSSGDQTVAIDGTTVSSYQFYYNDTVTIDGGSYSVKSFAVILDGDVHTYIIDDNSPTIPGVTAGDSVTLESYANFTRIKYSNVACFAPGSHIETVNGLRPVEALRVGDLVQTLDHGYQPIRWAGHTHLSGSALQSSPHLMPVRIPVNALGPGRPAQDLVVSPQHRILLSGWEIEMCFGESQMLVPARSLVGKNGIRTEAPAEGISYHHIMFDNHEVVLSEGLPTESFLVGETIRNGLDQAQLQEILTLFPDLAEDSRAKAVRPARPILKGYEVQALTTLAA